MTAASTRNAAYQRLRKTLALSRNKTQVARFQERAREFGETRFSIGSIVELDRHARGHLGKRDAYTDLVVVFWDAFDAVRRRERARPVAMDFDQLDRGALAALGPVDAHLLAEVSRDAEAWLATGDRRLRGVASERSRGRVLHLPS